MADVPKEYELIATGVVLALLGQQSTVIAIDAVYDEDGTYTNQIDITLPSLKGEFRLTVESV